MTVEQKTIIINGERITAYSDGSITRPDGAFERLRVKRNYGSKSSSKGATTYSKVQIGGKFIGIHRIIAKVFLDNYDESLTVDHINGIKTDNRPCNLRMMDIGQQCRAYASTRISASSKYRGVSKYTGNKWRATIQARGRVKHIGVFDSEEDAAKMYDMYARAKGFDDQALNVTRFPELGKN